MYMMFNNFEKKWSLGLLYDNPAVPEHLKVMLRNQDHLKMKELTSWLVNHHVQAIAYCTGNWKDRLKSYRFRHQFNGHMKKAGMLADLGDFYHAVMDAEKRKKERKGMMSAIFHRTSIRKYKDKKVEREKVKLLMRAAMAAPSACNQQPWEFYVVTDKDKLNQLSQCSPYAGMLKEAPLGIVVCCRRDCQLPDYAQIDSSAAIENLLLEADSLGLGAVWLGVAPLKERMEAVEKVLEMPEHLYAFSMIACGYPAEEREQQNRYDEARVHYVE